MKKQARLKSIEFIKQHGAFEFLKTSIPNLFSALSKQKMAGAINDFIDQQAGSEASSLIAYYEAMMNRPDRRSLLKNSRIPLLFLLGKYDVAVPFSDGLAQCHLPAISYIHILRRSGHMGMMEEAESANKALKTIYFKCIPFNEEINSDLIIHPFTGCRQFCRAYQRRIFYL